MSLWVELGVVASSIVGWEFGKWISSRWVARKAADSERCHSRACAGRSQCRSNIGYGMLCGDQDIYQAAKAEFRGIR